MHVTVSHHDQETARRVAVALVPLCDALAPRADQDQCCLSVAPGVVVADFYAKDGAHGQVAVGVRALAAALLAGPETLARYADQMVAWAKRRQNTDRLTRGIGFALSLN